MARMTITFSQETDSIFIRLFCVAFYSDNPTKIGKTVTIDGSRPELERLSAEIQKNRDRTNAQNERLVNTIIEDEENDFMTANTVGNIFKMYKMIESIEIVD